MKDEKLIGAILCGQVEIVTPADIGDDIACHSACKYTCLDTCKECRIGIEEYKILTCPFCGSRRDHYLFEVRCTGVTHNGYKCGTIINICTHYGVTPRSITTVVIGSRCCGTNDEDII